MFIFQQPVALFFSGLVLGKEAAIGAAIIPYAWAEDIQSSGTATSPVQQEEQKPPSAEQPKPSPEAPPKPEEPKVKQGVLDLLHGGISRRVLATADWLDSFFLDERVLKEENNTYVRFRYDVFPEEKSGVSYQPSFDVRLVLPELRKKTHLVFSSEPPTAPSDRPAPSHIAGSQVGPSETRNVSAGVHYFFKSTAEETFFVRAGAVLNLTSPALYIGPRYRLLIPLKPWDFRFSQEVVYRTDSRWQEETQFDFERPLLYDLFFRTNVTGLWYETTYGYFYSLNFSLREAFSPTQAVQYEWTNSYQTRPINQLTEVAVRIRYRHSFWKEWIFFEVAPQCRFPRDRNFAITPGILFRFEAFFGRTP